MSDSEVAIAKITRPSAQGVLPRPRLFAALDAAWPGALAWIAAPPGAGKTSLASSYVQADGCAHLWYQVDRGDSDVATFFHYLSAAAAQRGLAPGAPLPGYSVEYLGDLPGFARRFFRELFSRLAERTCIVVDNFHDLAPGDTLARVLEYAAGEIPDSCLLVVLSRALPPPNMARLMAAGRIEVIDWETLKLTREETEEIVRARTDDAPASLGGEIHDLTSGWAAGLALMLTHSRSGALPRRTAGEFIPQVVFDFLAGEVFEKLDPQTQAFLLRASFLPQLTGSMATRLGKVAEAAEILHRLAHNHYLVSERHGPTGSVYELHPLLREYLMRLARERYPLEQQAEIRREAAVLLGESGEIDAAIEMLLEAGDWDRVVDLLSRHAPVILEQGRLETLGLWFDELPLEELRRNPWLLYWAGECRFYARPRECRRLYEQAYAQFLSAETPQPRGLLLAASSIVNSIMFEGDDLSGLDAWLPRLGKLLTGGSDGVSEAIRTRALCIHAIALVLRRPDDPDLTSLADEAVRLFRRCEDELVRIPGGPTLAIALSIMGRFAQAEEILRIANTLAERHYLSPLRALMLSTAEAMHALLTGDLKRCAAATAANTATGHAHAFSHWSALLNFCAMSARLGLADFEGAHLHMEHFARSAKDSNRLARTLYHYCAGWCAALEGDAVLAYQQHKIAMQLAIDVGIPIFEMISRLALALLLFEQGEERSGTVQLRNIHQLAGNISAPLIEFMALLPYAYLALRHNRKHSALNSLRYALRSGREHRFVHMLGWQPTMMAALCEAALENDIESDYVRLLIRERDLFPTAPPLHVERWPWPARIRALGRLSVTVDDRPLGGNGKLQGRPAELLKTLIAFGAREVNADQLGAALWPHVDGDYAYRTLTTNLHRLRKALGSDDFVLLADGMLGVNPRRCWLDTWALEDALAAIERQLRRRGDGPGTEELENAAARLFDLYRGAFLAADLTQSHLAGYREQLRSRLLRTLGLLAAALEEAGSSAAAADLFERAIDADDLCEGFYRSLMKCYQRAGQAAEAINAYERCRSVLAAKLQSAPSAETTALHRQLLQEP